MKTSSRQAGYEEEVNRLLSAPARPLTNPEPKQTVFNDANYVPATQINTISMAQPRVATAVQLVKTAAVYGRD